MSACIALVALAPSSGYGSSSIDYEPISLEQAYRLIDSGQVYRIAVRQHHNIDEYFLLQGSPGYDLDSDTTPRWGVEGEDVHLFTEGMPTGVPILSDDKDEVGLTSDQFESFFARVEQYNATASSRIDVLDQRIYSRD